MDYEFSIDELGRPRAKFSMGAEAIGRWFSEELSDDQQQINQLVAIVETLEQGTISDYQQSGKEFQLRLNQNEIEVVALALDLGFDDELPEETNLYDEESYAGCGLPDFKQALLSWQSFVA
ncbi:YacL family protein [Neptunomonas qingdaonensis]|uniref:Uncharacterized protein n=1 Tax=Neptunomonas qingdaonensis TaxID=1045558 RepID=A0A1I2UVU4_9GAMM|nr:YacL family protein [Neptunomonas qingdaonensis]SFG81285.1 hypothetical protein SAMN05216175_11478 [Neptunomonas qingdaonensis]